MQWHEPWLADRLLRGIVLEAPVADASELADAVAVLHPEIRFFLVRGLATMGAKPVARHLLSTWVKENPSPSTNDIAGFLSACREQGEPEIVWQAFGEVLSRPASNDLIARYSEAIAAEFGIGALAPFWGSLPQEVTERRPLLAAQLAFHEHNLAMTKWLLGKVDLATLGTSYRQTWIDLLMAVTAPPDAFGVLRDLRRSGHLPADLLPQVRPPCRRARAGHRVSRSARGSGAQCPLIQAAATDPCDVRSCRRAPPCVPRVLPGQPARALRRKPRNSS